MTEEIQYGTTRTFTVCATTDESGEVSILHTTKQRYLIEQYDTDTQFEETIKKKCFLFSLHLYNKHHTQMLKGVFALIRTLIIFGFRNFRIATLYVK